MCSSFGFSIEEFLISFFIVKKWPLFVNFSITSLCKMMLSSRFHTFRGYKIVGMYLTHQGQEYREVHFMST
jgi:hypothetical protein